MGLVTIHGIILGWPFLEGEILNVAADLADARPKTYRQQLQNTSNKAAKLQLTNSGFHRSIIYFRDNFRISATSFEKRDPLLQTEPSYEYNRELPQQPQRAKGLDQGPTGR